MAGMAGDTPAGMSDYERQAWQALLAEAGQQRRQSRFAGWTQAVKDRAQDAASTARGAVGRLPGVDAAIGGVNTAVATAMAGLHTLLVERGLDSVKPDGIFAMFADEGVPVRCYDDIRRLDLQLCDRSVPRRRDRYVAFAATEGAASSLAVTGGAVSAVVSGGTTAAIAVSAIAADVTTVMVGMGRIVALVGAHYGYDVREPQEQLYAAGVIAYSVAGSPAEEAAALASLSRLTQQLTRSAVSRQLRQRQLVNGAQRVFTSLGMLLTKRKLVQAVPLVGAVINGGLNARIAAQTFDRAQRAYRLRFLTQKYRLDSDRWAPQVVRLAAGGLPLVDEVLDAELAADPATD